MADQKFYQSQPEVLPKTLPAGARNHNGIVFLSEMRLAGEQYNGRVRFRDGTESVRDIHLRTIDWTSVPLPEPADRPIQAGDWVECVDENRAYRKLRAGDRYEVAIVDRLADGSPGIALAGDAGLWWAAHRFKRVDGPHPDTTECMCASCFEGGCFGEQECALAGDGKWYCVKVCLSEALERYGAHKDSSVPIGTGNAQSSGAGEDPKRDPYTEHRTIVEPYFANTRPLTSEAIAARARLEAWSRAEKPRVTNRAEAAELAKPHPWEMHDD